VLNGEGASYEIGFAVGGQRVVRQDGRETVVQRGDFTILDESRPSSTTSDQRFQAICCVLPRHLVSIPPERIARITATAIHGQHGIAWVLAPFLQRFTQLLEQGEVDDIYRLMQHTIDLVDSLCAAQLNDNGPRSRSRAELLLRVRAYIEANLGDPELSPGRIASAHYISKTSLHRLFASEETSVARFIRHRRLERCRQWLCDPAHAHEPVWSIGSRWALPDTGHFSRLFRAAYGCTPGEYRRQQSAATG
jgi:AraC-like DNA-binding protein